MPELRSISFFVAGEPKTQGSLRAFVVPGKGGAKPRAVLTNQLSGTKPWRSLVAMHAQESAADLGCPWDGPVAVDLTFFLQRPASHRGPKGLRAGAPRYPHGRVGDLDKFVRLVFDALQGVVLTDDARVCEITAAKSYANEQPGVQVSVRQLEAT